MSNIEKVDYDELYRNYSEKILKMNKKYTCADESLAQDALQAAFMALVIKVNNNEKIDNYFNFLLTAAKNYAINIRKKYSNVDFSDDIAVYSDAVCQELSSEDEYFFQEETLIMQEYIVVILEGIREKNEMWYYVITQVFYEDRTQVDVAKELNMTTDGVYATIRRIREWAQRNKIDFLEDLARAKENQE